MQHKLIRRAAMFITSVLAMTVLFAVPVFAATLSDGGLKISDISVTGFPDGYSASDVKLCEISEVSKSRGGDGLMVVVKLGVYEVSDKTQWGNMDIKFSYSYDDGTYSKSGTCDGGSSVFDSGSEVYQKYAIYATKTKADDSSSSKDDDSSSSKDDDDDDDSGMSLEERQQEMERNFAPNASTLTPEQSAGWSLVSREAPAISSGAGVTATSAYQGPACRLAFQLAAPGYSIGHTYNMTFGSAGGAARMRTPSDLVKSGRRFVLSFVTSDGRYVSTPAITADASGYLNFNLTGLGLAANSNNAVAIMYLD
ncbi:MAG: hypothetical protein IJU43_00625 [Lachnospiraceae bacterium]|nr:hypothetical protein [Lachnospiraceae bacterium]